MKALWCLMLVACGHPGGGVIAVYDYNGSQFDQVKQAVAELNEMLGHEELSVSDGDAPNATRTLRFVYMEFPKRGDAEIGGSEMEISTDVWGVADMRHALWHELGHTYGLEHTEADKCEVMNAIFCGDDEAARLRFVEKLNAVGVGRRQGRNSTMQLGEQARKIVPAAGYAHYLHNAPQDVNIQGR